MYPLLDFSCLCTGLIIPAILAIFSDWSSKSIGFVTGTLICSVVVIYDLYTVGGSLINFIFGFPFALAILGLFYWGIIVLVRKVLRISPEKDKLKRDSEVRKAKALPSSDAEHIVCSLCSWEQWYGYKQCQKCGTEFEQANPINHY